VSKGALRAFRVVLVLFEKDSNLGEWEKGESTVAVLTFETGFESARKLAESAYMEADETDREDFEWRATSIEELDEPFTIPKTSRVLPRPK
jgi:hypothetical protein